MKLEDVVVVTKGACLTADGFLGPIVVGLAQWANTGEWPSNIVWVIILAMAFKGAANSLLGFLSQSFGNWKAQRTVDAGGTAPPFIKTTAGS